MSFVIMIFVIQIKPFFTQPIRQNKKLIILRTKKAFIRANKTMFYVSMFFMFFFIFMTLRRAGMHMPNTELCD